MFRGKRRLARVATVFCVVAMVLQSCSPTESGSQDSPGRVPQELLDSLNSHCTDLQAPSLGEGTLCVDSGFRVKVDDFSFANYGRDQSADANVTIQTLIDLFGHSAVCTPGDEERCVLRPTTIQKLEEWNNALAGGRCEGFAALSTRFSLGMENPARYRSGVTRVVDLEKYDSHLQSSIVYWWSTQFLREVSDRAAASRQKSPLALVDDLIQGIANRVGYTLAIYSASQGHSVTPFAVTRRGSAFVIHVYDNNYPGVRKEISVDSRTNTWTYADATPDSPGGWSGRTGTMELTPLSARQGPFECTFCNVAAIPSGAPSVISLASRDPGSPGYVRITSRGGAVLETSPGGVSNSIPGAVVTASKGTSAGLSTIEVPGNSGDLDIEIRRGSASIPAGDVVLTIQRPGAATVQVSGNLATTVAGTEGSGNPVITLRNGELTVTTPPGQLVRVSLAAGSNLSRTTLEPGQSLVISAVLDNTVDISLKGAGGSPLGTATVDASGSTDPNMITITADPSTSTLSTASASITAVPVQKRSTNEGSTTSTSTSSPTTTAPPRPATTTSSVPTIEITLPSRSVPTTNPTKKIKGRAPKSTTTTVPKSTTTTSTSTTSSTTTTSSSTTTSSTTPVTTTTDCPGNSCHGGNNGNNGNGDG